MAEIDAAGQQHSRDQCQAIRQGDRGRKAQSSPYRIPARGTIWQSPFLETGVRVRIAGQRWVLLRRIERRSVDRDRRQRGMGPGGIHVERHGACAWQCRQRRSCGVRGGTVVIHGDAAARLGVSMKGGTVLVGGNCGYMAGFMGQKGTLIVCGDAGEAFADSMYATVCFVGGKIDNLGTDAVLAPMDPSDIDASRRNIDRPIFRPSCAEPSRAAVDFKKVVAGRKLGTSISENGRSGRRPSSVSELASKRDLCGRASSKTFRPRRNRACTPSAALARCASAAGRPSTISPFFPAP